MMAANWLPTPQVRPRRHEIPDIPDDARPFSERPALSCKDNVDCHRLQDGDPGVVGGTGRDYGRRGLGDLACARGCFGGTSRTTPSPRTRN